jgi:septum formation protein
MEQRPDRLILASSSPRRQELIKSLGLPYEIVVSEADETTPPGLSPADIVEMLAERKARSVFARIGESVPRAIVIGSDTIVVVDGEVLGKPADESDSLRMLQRLQGRTHVVYSGVACVDTADGRTVVRHRATKVFMKPLDEDRIRRYIGTGEPRDKAGSYAIQGIGATLVDAIEGDYFNVVGLPVSLLSDMLDDMGLPIL